MAETRSDGLLKLLSLVLILALVVDFVVVIRTALGTH